MKTLKQALNEITDRKRPFPAIMGHVVLGYPSLKESLELVQVMERSGVSLVELQIPFSDPIADGPTIMFANQEALAKGVTPEKCLAAVAKLQKLVEIPLLCMSYFNPLYTFKGGFAGFLKKAKQAGFQGLIIPDLPPDDRAEHYLLLARKYDLTPIPIVSPVTPTARLKKLSSLFDAGFVYCVSTTGTTGARKTLPPGLNEYLKRVKKHFCLPLAVGFGISKPEHVRALKNHADIAIVGSATIDSIRQTKQEIRKDAVGRFFGNLTP